MKIVHVETDGVPGREAARIIDSELKHKLERFDWWDVEEVPIVERRRKEQGA